MRSLYTKTKNMRFSKMASLFAVYLISALFAIFSPLATPVWSNVIELDQSVDQSTPDGLVKTMTVRVVNALKANPTLQAGNMKKLIELINKEILPYTNIEKTTQLAVNRGWIQASEKQKAELVEQFKTLLIYTYAGALANTGDPQIEILPLIGTKKSDDAAVKTRMMRQGEPIEVAYRLSKIQDKWFLYDIGVAGVWLVQNYRQQFEGTLNRSGVVGLIKSLEETNQRLAGHA